MNLHNIASAYTGVVNPWITASIQQSNGYTTDSNGVRTPAYNTPVSLLVQRQSLQWNDLRQLDGINIEGVRCKFYLNGNWQGVVRADRSGGDLITLPDGSVWLCVLVLENWALQDGWVAIACTLQNGN